VTVAHTRDHAEGAVARTLADASEIAASRERVRSRLVGRERGATLVLGGGFLAAAVACAIFIASPRPFSIGAAALLVAIYAFVSQIEFEVGPGSAVPTELVLVPMLFVLPPGAVPLAVAFGLLLGGVADRLRSRRHGDRVAVLLCSSWHSVGPAVVIGLFASGSPSWNRAPVYIAALLAQVLFDVASVLVRHRLGRSVPVFQLVRSLEWVVIVDGALAPVAFLVAWAAVNEPAAALCVLPLAGLLHLLGVERSRRIDDSLVLGRAMQDASREARSDPLTRTGNRLAWQEAVEDAALGFGQDGDRASVVLVDLDRLKETNDTQGHDAGDRFIQALAGTLAAVVPPGATLARIGGDEFAVLALGIGGRGCTELVAQIRHALANLDVAGIRVSASVGASSCPPCASLDEALRLADERLYTDKATSASDP
jgi:diguanylate cyclase (GGDEF)-like protein